MIGFYKLHTGEYIGSFFVVPAIVCVVAISTHELLVVDSLVNVSNKAAQVLVS